MKPGTLLCALTMAVAGWVTVAAQPPKPGSPSLVPQSAKPLPPGFKASAAPSTPPATPPSGPPVDNSRPEPSALYGYVTVIDPATGQRYIADPNATASQRGSGLSFDRYVTFRRTANPSQTYTWTQTAGTAFYRFPPVAVWYCIQLMQDSTAGDLPVFNVRDNKLHYDPAKWRYKSLDMGTVQWQDTSDSGAATSVQVSVRPVAPIGDFPDFNGSVAGPPR